MTDSNRSSRFPARPYAETSQPPSRKRRLSRRHPPYSFEHHTVPNHETIVIGLPVACQATATRNSGPGLESALADCQVQCRFNPVAPILLGRGGGMASEYCSMASLMPSSAAKAVSGRLRGGSISRRSTSLRSLEHLGTGSSPSPRVSVHSRTSGTKTSLAQAATIACNLH